MSESDDKIAIIKAARTARRQLDGAIKGLLGETDAGGFDYDTALCLAAATKTIASVTERAVQFRRCRSCGATGATEVTTPGCWRGEVFCDRCKGVKGLT